MSLEFSHYPLAPSHNLRSGFGSLGQTVRLMKAREFIAQENLAENLSVTIHLLNQFTGRELRA